MRSGGSSRLTLAWRGVVRAPRAVGAGRGNSNQYLSWHAPWRKKQRQQNKRPGAAKHPGRLEHDRV